MINIVKERRSSVQFEALSNDSKGRVGGETENKGLVPVENERNPATWRTGEGAKSECLKVAGSSRAGTNVVS